MENDSMQIVIHEGGDAPIYQKIVDAICKKIQDGTWSAGYKLPTVREMAGDISVSCGTVKHAYDELGQLGLIQMTQGKGTFVREAADQEASSKKEQAMKSIEGMIDKLEKLGFSEREIRIFFDLKLRERDEMYENVRIGVVDCNPEALAVIDTQLSALPNVDIYKFLLEEVKDAPFQLGEKLDLVITTANHFGELEGMLADGGKLARMVLSPSQRTVMELAKVSITAKVGILCVSKKFSDIIRKSCSGVCTLVTQPESCILGEDEQTEAFIEEQDILIMPQEYLKFCSGKEEAALGQFLARGKKIISFDYHIDQGSFLYLSEQIDKIYRNNRGE